VKWKRKEKKKGPFQQSIVRERGRYGSKIVATQPVKGTTVALDLHRCVPAPTESRARVQGGQHTKEVTEELLVIAKGMV